MPAHTICFVTNQISPGTKGGIGRLIKEVSHDLYKAGWSILFLLDVDGNALNEFRAYLASEMPGAECFSVEELLDSLSSDEDIPFWAFRFPHYYTSYRIALALHKLCQRREIGGIEFNDYMGLGYVTLKWRRLWGETFSGVKMWVRLHGSKELWERADDRVNYSIGGQQLYNMERYVLKHADAWVAPSAAVISWYSEYYGLTKPSFCKAPGFEKIGPPNVHPRQVTGTPKKILFFGKLQRLKGADVFVRAAVRLCEETDQPLEFEVIGHDEPLSWKYDSFQEELEAMILARYQDRFHFRGRVNPQSLPVIARECILAVVPSRVETFCLAAHELNWIGIPLVLNDIPAFKERLTDGQNCRKFDGTAEGLTTVIQEILETPNPFDNWTWDADRIDTDPLPLYQDLLDRCCPFTPASQLNKARLPLVTVVVPYYNTQDYVDDTIDSVLNSTYPNWEMILIDNGSPAPEAIAKFEELQRRFAADDRISFLQKPNGGLGDTRNYGLKHAKGQYILPLDSDDIIPSRIYRKGRHCPGTQPRPGCHKLLRELFSGRTTTQPGYQLRHSLRSHTTLNRPRKPGRQRRQRIPALRV